MTFKRVLFSGLGLLMMEPAVSCRAPPDYTPVVFAQHASNAKHVAIVRVERQSLSPDAIAEPPLREVIAHVRVVESLIGSDPGLSGVLYQAYHCGGHRLDVGGYYVVALPEKATLHRLGFMDESIAGLGDEYREPLGDPNRVSVLLMHLRNLKKGYAIPPAFRADPYVGLTRMPSQAPSWELER